MAEKKKATNQKKEIKKQEKEKNIAEIFTTSPNQEKKKQPRKKGNTKTKKRQTSFKKAEKEKEEKKLREKNLETKMNTSEIKSQKIKDNPSFTHELRIMVVILLLVCFFCFLILNDRLRRIESKINLEPITYYINPRTVFFGDSITGRYDLQKYFENDTYINQGIDGNETTDLLERMKTSIYDYNPERVILLIGTNDLYAGTPIDEIASNISLIIKKIQKNNSKTEILVESVLPINNNEDESEKINENTVGSRTNNDIKNLNKKIRAVCEKMGVIYINAFDEFTNQDGNLKIEYTVDGLHLSNEGYQKQTEILNQAIQNSKNQKKTLKNSRK